MAVASKTKPRAKNGVAAKTKPGAMDRSRDLVRDAQERFRRVTRDTTRNKAVQLALSVVEFQNERLERMLPIIADEHAFQNSRHRVEIYGVCRECRQRELGAL